MEEYYRYFFDFVTFKFNDDYKHTLQAEKGDFYPFKEKGPGSRPPGPFPYLRTWIHAAG